MPKTKYKVVHNDRGTHNFPIGTTVRLVRTVKPPKGFPAEAMSALYEGITENNGLIQQWLRPDEVRRAERP